MNVHVERGTNAGVRRPFEGRPESWRCACSERAGRIRVAKKNPGYLAACPDCGERRP